VNPLAFLYSFVAGLLLGGSAHEEHWNGIRR